MCKELCSLCPAQSHASATIMAFSLSSAALHWRHCASNGPADLCFTRNTCPWLSPSPRSEQHVPPSNSKMPTGWNLSPFVRFSLCPHRQNSHSLPIRRITMIVCFPNSRSLRCAAVSNPDVPVPEPSLVSAPPAQDLDGCPSCGTLIATQARPLQGLP
jgi:hypothetical protein